ncbi:MAG: BTAD domain-containing putative transcriptional regulator [Chloroflexota bacterium]
MQSISSHIVRFLGPLEIEQAGLPVSRLGSQKSLALLLYLIIEARSINRAELASLLWPDKPEAKGRSDVRWALNNLSKLLPGAFITTPRTITFQSTDTLEIDLHTFQKLTQQGDIASLSRAADLYRGELLTNLIFDDCPEFEIWLIQEREMWRQQIIRILEQLINHHIEAGSPNQGQPFALKLLDIEPWREEAHRYLMRLFVQQGLTEAALAQYETCRQILETELDVEPLPETDALVEQIRNGTLPTRDITSEPLVETPLTRQASATSSQAGPPPTYTPDLALALSRLDTPEEQLFGIETAQTYLASALKPTAAPWLISLDGIGGIGKTSLAAALVRELAPTGQFQDVAWVSAKQESFLPAAGIQETGYPALTKESLTDNLLEQLSETTSLLTSVREKEVALLQLLKTAPYLIVVDNLETVTDYQALVPYLRRLAKPSKILLTSRLGLRAYADVYCYSLTEMNATDTIAFLRYQAEIRGLIALQNANNSQLVHIYEVAGGNPLALKLVLSQSHFLPLSEILQNLKQAQGKRIDELYTYIYWQAWHMLDEAARQLFLMMPLNPNATFQQLVNLEELPFDDLQSALEQLTRLSLLQVSADLEQPSYRLHRLTETFLLTEVLKWQAPL